MLDDPSHRQLEHPQSHPGLIYIARACSRITVWVPASGGR